ncbi:hypothetical protein Cyrtocomes_01171 [Candidatus Cyrtobacter comes]|uniref:Uncharacterized protein n=1 Tax=Candidatus Cyrtobacter comes TaxID=675776 RepID=A0ABU5L9H3_9RICK|nr:hypothetical protein [Candidatus Cyrtobacter comes]MDZ5762776.1 hypothetical protein [Candidatus Cyrtobacter comes]
MSVNSTTFYNWNELVGASMRLANMISVTGRLVSRFNSLKVFANKNDTDYFCVQAGTQGVSSSVAGIPISVHNGYCDSNLGSCIKFFNRQMLDHKINGTAVIFNNVLEINCVTDNVLLQKCNEYTIKINFNCIFTKEIGKAPDIHDIYNNNKIPNIVIGVVSGAENDGVAAYTDWVLNSFAHWNVVLKLDRISTDCVLGNLSNEFKSIFSLYSNTFGYNEFSDYFENLNKEILDWYAKENY